MSEVQNYIFTFKEIAQALVKAQGLHEGLWAIYVEFGIGAGHIPAGPNAETLVPAAVIPIVKMGIQRAEQASPLTVDAAEVNPLPRFGPKSRRGTAGVGARIVIESAENKGKNLTRDSIVRG